MKYKVEYKFEREKNFRFYNTLEDDPDDEMGKIEFWHASIIREICILHDLHREIRGSEVLVLAIDDGIVGRFIVSVDYKPVFSIIKKLDKLFVDC